MPDKTTPRPLPTVLIGDTVFVADGQRITSFPDRRAKPRGDGACMRERNHHAQETHPTQKQLGCDTCRHTDGGNCNACDERRHNEG